MDRVNPAHRLAIIGLFLGIVFWIAESAVHAHYFGENLVDHLTSFNDPHEFWTRSLYLLALVIFVTYARSIVAKLDKAQQAVRRSGELQSHILNSLPVALYAARPRPGLGATWMLGQVESTTGNTPQQLIDDASLWFSRIHPDDRAAVSEQFKELLHKGALSSEYRWKHADGSYRWFFDQNTLLRDEQGNPREIIGVWMDITQRKQAEESLWRALEESLQSRVETAALLEGARAVLEHNRFVPAARAIVAACKNLTGATAGYVILRNQDETGELLFLELDSPSETTDSLPPALVDRLTREVHRTGKAAYDNSPALDDQRKLAVDREIDVDCALQAPIVVEGKVSGIIGFANKPGGFTDHDARLASTFGELVAVALRDSETLESLENSEERFRSVVQTASDAIICTDSGGEIILWNRSAERIFGYSAVEALGQPIGLVIPGQLRELHLEAFRKAYSTGNLDTPNGRHELVGLRKDGSEFPAEVSFGMWNTRVESCFTSIVRDITDRKM